MRAKVLSCDQKPQERQRLTFFIKRHFSWQEVSFEEISWKEKILPQFVGGSEYSSINALFALYNRLLKQLEAFEKPYQTWICIHEQDPMLDAVYVHSPNPNDDDFPHKLEELEPNCKLPHTFKDLVDLHQFDVSCYRSECEEVYYIQSKAQGISL